MATEKSLEALLDERYKLHQEARAAEAAQSGNHGPSAALPPTMQKVKEVGVDELLREMNRIPLFMTSLDETDGEGGENIDLEALKALAYEGTRAEIAQNFREQGTELIRMERRFPEAREYYTKALQALRAPPVDSNPEIGPAVVEVDNEAEAKKEREIEEVCLVNRALCNMEMSMSVRVALAKAQNYGSCNRDCAAALRLNPKNVKAWYRAAQACLALDKVTEALDACISGLQHDPKNGALQLLKERCEARRDRLAAIKQQQEERERLKNAEAATLRTALLERKITTRTTPHPPEIPESAISLSDPQDPTSNLSFPVMLLYPAHAQTDFIKAFAEDSALADHLEYILPLPWDEKGEYAPEKVDAYMETVSGGLIKVGKKISLLKVLGGGKVEVVDGLVKINVLPRDRVDDWIGEFKARRGK